EKVILNTPLQYEVGSDVIYSCTGYITLGKILEKVGGVPLDELFNEYVVKPLDLKTIGYNLKHDHIAKTSDDDEAGIVHDPNARFMGGVSGNAGVFASIDSVSQFACLLANRGTLHGKTYIKPAMFKCAIKNYSKEGFEARGLGFSLKQDHTSPAGDLFSIGTYGHTGYTGTDLWVDEETGTYIVFLTNRVYLGDENRKIIPFRRVLHNCIMNELFEMGHLS
ncbi:MAG: serine hydrolase domain-containing protein, partial [Turicibacter sp.]